MEWDKLAEEEIKKYSDPSTKNRYELKRIKGILKHLLKKVNEKLRENCKIIEENLLLFLENELNPKLKEKFEKHIKVCPNCQSLVKDSKKLLKLRGKFEREKIPQELARKIKTRLKTGL